MKRIPVLFTVLAVFGLGMALGISAFLLLRQREIVVPDGFRGVMVLTLGKRQPDQRVWELSGEGRILVSPEAFAVLQKPGGWSARRAAGVRLPVQVAFPRGVQAPPLPEVGLHRLLQSRNQVVYFVGTELEARDAAVDEEMLLSGMK